MLDPLGGVCVCLSVSGLTGERRGSQVTFWIGYNSQTCSGRDLNPVCDIWRYIFHEHSHPYKHSDVTGLGRWGARLSVQWWTSRSLLLLRVHTSLGDTLHHYQLENSSINSSKCCLRTFLCNFTLKTSQVYTSWRLDVNDGRDMAPAVFSDNCQSWAVIYIYIHTSYIRWSLYRFALGAYGQTMELCLKTWELLPVLQKKQLNPYFSISWNDSILSRNSSMEFLSCQNLNSQNVY